MIHISSGNKKLPTGTLNFSLPPQTSCPFATEECKKHCYAMKSFRQYPNVRNAWTENFEESKTKDFVQKVVSFLQKKRKWSQFRISVAGDLYNQEYFNKWCEIAKQFPTKIFYLYTKTYIIDTKSKPKNMIMFLSDDKQLLKQYWDKFDGVASVSTEHVNKKKGWFVCPYPKITCADCDFCYTKSKGFKKLLFNIH